MRKLLLLFCVLYCFGCNNQQQAKQAFATTFTATNRKIYLIKNYYADASVLGYIPGDTLSINTTRASLYIYNLKGTREKPVIIMAEPGVKIIGIDSRAFKFEVDGSSYFKVIGINVKGTGDGGPGGFKFYYDHHFSFENSTGDSIGVGCFVKNDPNPADPNTYYPTKIIGVRIANVTITNTTNEGFYIGPTKDTLNGKKNSSIDSIELYNLRTENTGWDGIQVTNADHIVANNLTAINAGLKRVGAQQTGITIQDATRGTWNNLIIDKCTGSGLFIFSGGDVVLNNVNISNVASSGIFIDGRNDWGMNLPPQKLIATNIVLNGGGAGAPLYYGNTPPKPIAGTVTNLMYDKTKWGKALYDPYNKYNTGPVPPVKTVYATLIITGIGTYNLYTDSTWDKK